MAILDDDTLETATSGNIFISYSRGDRDFRSQLEQLLIDEGYNPEYDEEGIASGEAWQTRLKEMIGACDTFLIVLTDDWARSENCRKEFVIARDNDKRIIPVLPDPLGEGEGGGKDEMQVREALAKLNYIHFFPLKDGDGGGFYRGLSRLKRSLRDDLVQLRLRRRYEARAEGWQAGEDDLLSGDQLTQALSWMEKEAHTGGVSEEVAKYISASEAARDKAARAQARNRLVLVGLIVVALGTIGLAFFQQNQTRLAEGDAEIIAEIAKDWAETKAALASSLASSGDDPASFRPAIDDFEAAFAEMQDVRRKGGQRLLTEIGFDWSRAHYNLSEFETSRSVLDRFKADIPSNYFLGRARHAVANLVLDCAEGVPVTALEGSLQVLPGPVIDQVTSDIMVQWESPHPRCEAAWQAICRVGDCVDEELEFEADFEAPANDGLFESPEVPDDEFTEEESSARSGAQRRRGFDIPDDPAAQEGDLGVSAPARRRRSLSQPPPVVEPDYDPDFKVEQVFLHISKEDDRTAARQIAKTLSERGYKVLGIELVPSADGLNRSVRYYYNDQREEAEDLRDLCAEAASRIKSVSGWADDSTYRVISLAGRYGGLPQNRIEIWL
ncbi:MAG: toll/interleukin-1 receptor domain-containing protein [Pseudomonadota bacterium]